jgi:hypothetical protein
VVYALTCWPAAVRSHGAVYSALWASSANWASSVSSLSPYACALAW